jgi:hypothetical protein
VTTGDGGLADASGRPVSGDRAEADFSSIGGVTVRVRGDSAAGSAGVAPRKNDGKHKDIDCFSAWFGKCCRDGVRVPIDTPRKDRT